MSSGHELGLVVSLVLAAYVDDVLMYVRSCVFHLRLSVKFIKSYNRFLFPQLSETMDGKSFYVLIIMSPSDNGPSIILS